MRVVYQVLWYPEGEYRGGIIKIVQDYFSCEQFFVEKHYELRLFNHQIRNSLLFRLPLLGSKIKNLSYYFSQRKALVKELNRNTDAIVHIQSAKGWTLYRDLHLARSIKRRTGNPVIMTVHFADIDQILYSGRIARHWELSAMNRFLDRVIFLGDKVRQEFVDRGIDKSKTRVLTTFHNYSLSELPCKTYSPFKLLFVGSLNKRKGIIDLLQALSELDDPEITLDICGGKVDDSIRKEFDLLCDELGDRIRFNGYVAGDRKRELFEESNVIVLPSYGEGMPIVLMEAMATGCGIIATNVGCIPEIVTSQNGILIAPGNVKELCGAIRLLKENRQRLKQIEKSNFEFGKTVTLPKNIERLTEIYNEV